MHMVADELAKTFAVNRAVGQISLRAAKIGERTRCRELHERGSLRVRFPNASTDDLEAVLINTAGGIAGGDRFAVEIMAEAGAAVVAGTAAAEKVYRSSGSPASLSIRLDVGSGARLAWLPQETILFDNGIIDRRIDIDLAADASLVLVEGLVFGRSAMGETVMNGTLIDRWRVRRNGRLVFAETTRLKGPIASRLSEPAVAGGCAAIATLLIAPDNEKYNERCVEVVRACGPFRGEAAISAWNGLAVARLCARDGATLRHDLTTILAALNVPLPRLWLQ